MFDHIIGQEKAKDVIRGMFESGKIPHCLLFVGPYGVGKGEMALECARVLLCKSGMDSEYTTCGSCVRATKLEHPDLHVLFPYRLQPETIKAYDEWLDGFHEHKHLLAHEPYAPHVYEKGRQIVTGLVSEVYTRLMESSFEGGRKVCVILSADRLNDKTANALLKIFEEPPDDVHFFLTTERLSSVLPTIASRATIIRFRRLTMSEIEKYLEHNGVEERKKRLLYASLAEGSIKTAKAFAFGDKAEVHSRAVGLYRSTATERPEHIISYLFPYLRSRDAFEVEELIYGFSLCTKAVLEKKFGVTKMTGIQNEGIEMLTSSVDISALHRISVRLEEGLEMLGRNVTIPSVLAPILFEIQDAYGKG